MAQAAPPGRGLAGRRADALPLDARNRERLEWVAEEVVEAGGTAGVWVAQPGSRQQEHTLVADLRAARRAEYARVVEEAEEAAGIDDEVARRRAVRRVRRVRRKLRDVRRRDYCPPAERQQARAAVERLAATLITEGQRESAREGVR